MAYIEVEVVRCCSRARLAVEWSPKFGTRAARFWQCQAGGGVVSALGLGAVAGMQKKTKAICAGRTGLSAVGHGVRFRS